MDWRSDFPAISDQEIYLDSAATAHKPNAVIDAITECYSSSYATVHRAVYRRAAEMTEHYLGVRRKVQRFISASSEEEILFTKGTTESINLVAACLELEEGDEVVISEIEHHSNIVPWQIACAKSGASLIVAPVTDEGLLDLEAFEELLCSRTRLVAIAHISNVLGTIHPIEQITALAHEVGAKVLIDGAQAAPHLCIDVQRIDCDFYAFSGHKMYGPTGIGVLYGRRESLEEFAPYQSGGDMIERVTFEETTYGSLPAKFEAGTPPIAQVVGLGAAIDYLESIGFEAIHDHELELLERAKSCLLELPGLSILGETKSAIVNFAIEGVHPLDLGTLLDLKGISIRTGHLCAQPALERFRQPAFSRASFGVYNTLEEVERFARAVDGGIATLSPPSLA